MENKVASKTEALLLQARINPDPKYKDRVWSELSDINVAPAKQTAPSHISYFFTQLYMKQKLLIAVAIVMLIGIGTVIFVLSNQQQQPANINQNSPTADITSTSDVDKDLTSLDKSLSDLNTQQNAINSGLNDQPTNLSSN